MESLPLGGVDSKRDYVHVDDCCKALFLLSQKELSSDTYNIGLGEQISIRQFLDEVKNVNSEFNYLPDQFPPFKHEVKEICADMDLFYKDCGWKPEIGWREGILQTFGDNTSV